MTISPLDIDTANVTYPSNPLISVYDKLASHSLVAYRDVATGEAQTLALGATEDITLTSSKDISLYGGIDRKHIISITSSNNESTITSKTADMRLTTDDPLLHKIHVGSLTVRENPDVAILETDKPSGIYMNNDVTVDGNAEFKQASSFLGSVFCKDRHYAQNYNLYKSFNPLDHPTSATMTGYAFTINSNDQLELVRYNKFYNGNYVTTRVAVFGSGQLRETDPSDFQYVAFDELNGLSIVQGGTSYPIPSSPNAEDISNADLLALRNSHLALSNAHNTTATNLSTLTTRFNSFSTTANNLSADQQYVILTVDNHSLQLSNLYQFSSNIDTNTSNLTGHVIALQTASNNLSTSLTNLTTSTSAQIGSINTSITILTSSNQSLSNHVNILYGKDSTTNARVTTLSDTVSQIQSQISTIEGNVTGNVSQAITDLEEKVDSQASTFSGFSNQVSDAISTSAQTQASSNQKFTDDISSLSASLSSQCNQLISYIGATQQSQATTIFQAITESNNAQNILIEQAASSNQAQDARIDDLFRITTAHSSSNSTFASELSTINTILPSLSNSTSDLLADHVSLSNSTSNLLTEYTTLSNATRDFISSHTSEYTTLSNDTYALSNAFSDHVATLPQTRLLESADKTTIFFNAPTLLAPTATQLSVRAASSTFVNMDSISASFKSPSIVHTADGSTFTMLIDTQPNGATTTLADGTIIPAPHHAIFKAAPPADGKATDIVWSLSDILAIPVADRFEPVAMTPTSDGGLIVACELETTEATYTSLSLNNATTPTPTSHTIAATTPDAITGIVIKYNAVGDTQWVITIDGKSVRPTDVLELPGQDAFVLSTSLENGTPIVTDATGSANTLSSIPTTTYCTAVLKFSLLSGRYSTMATFSSTTAEMAYLRIPNAVRKSLVLLDGSSFAAIVQISAPDTFVSPPMHQFSVTDSTNFTLPKFTTSSSTRTFVTLVKFSPTLVTQYISTLELATSENRIMDFTSNPASGELLFMLTSSDDIDFFGFNEDPNGNGSARTIPASSPARDVFVALNPSGTYKWSMASETTDQLFRPYTTRLNTLANGSYAYLSKSAILELAPATGAIVASSAITDLQSSPEMYGFLSRGSALVPQLNFFMASPQQSPVPVPTSITFAADNFKIGFPPGSLGIAYLCLAYAPVPAPLELIFKANLVVDSLSGNIDASNLKDGSITTPKLAAESVTLAKLAPSISMDTALLGNKQALFSAQNAQSFSSVTLPDASMILWDTIALPPSTPIRLDADYKFTIVKEGYFFVHATRWSPDPALLWRIKVYSASAQLITSHFLSGSDSPQWIYLRPGQYFQIHYNDVNSVTLDYLSTLSVTHLPTLAYLPRDATPSSALIHFDASSLASLFAISPQTSSTRGISRNTSTSLSVRRLANLGSLGQEAAAFFQASISYDEQKSMSLSMSNQQFALIPSPVPIAPGTTVVLAVKLQYATLAAGQPLILLENQQEPRATIFSVAHHASIPSTAVITIANQSSQITEVNIQDFFEPTPPNTLVVYAFVIEELGMRVYRDGVSMYENMYPASGKFDGRVSTSTKFISTSDNTKLAEWLIMDTSYTQQQLAALSVDLHAKWAADPDPTFGIGWTSKMTVLPSSTLCTDADSHGNAYLATVVDHESNPITPSLIYNSNGTVSTSASFIALPTSKEGILVKYDSTGDAVWSASIVYNLNMSIHSMLIDGDGNVYITGSYNSVGAEWASIVVYDANKNPHNNMFRMYGNSTNVFLMKFTSSGSPLWVATIDSVGHQSYEESYDVKLDSFGNVYIAGFYGDSSTGDGIIYNAGNVESDVTLRATSSSYDGFLVKFNSNGIALWATSVGGANYEDAVSVAIDNAGNAYLAGYNDEGAKVYNNGQIEATNVILNRAGAFIVKFDSTGVAQSAVTINEVIDNHHITCDSLGNVYVTGHYSPSFLPTQIFNFDNTPGVVLPKFGQGDGAYLIKYNPSGVSEWAMAAIVTNYNIKAMDILIDKNDGIYWGVFNFESEATLYNGLIESNLQLPKGLNVVKLSSDGTASFSVGTTTGSTFSIDDQNHIYITGRFIHGTTTVLHDIDGTQNDLDVPDNTSYILQYNV